MVRGSAILAVVASALLTLVFLKQTRSEVLSGTIVAPPHFLGPIPPSLQGFTDPVWLSTTDRPSPALIDRYDEAGLDFSGLSLRPGSGGYWQFRMSDDASTRARIGDLLVVRAKRLALSRLGAVRHLRYEIRRGTEAWSVDEPGSWKFFLAYGIAGGGPLLLWGIAWGVTLLCGLSRKPRLRD